MYPTGEHLLVLLIRAPDFHIIMAALEVYKVVWRGDVCDDFPHPLNTPTRDGMAAPSLGIPVAGYGAVRRTPSTPSLVVLHRSKVKAGGEAAAPLTRASVAS